MDGLCVLVQIYHRVVACNVPIAYEMASSKLHATCSSYVGVHMLLMISKLLSVDYRIVFLPSVERVS